MSQFSKLLRKNSTDAENLLWNFLRNRRLQGYRFHRQYTIGPYIADFCCRTRKLIVEVDGGQHAESVQPDQLRTEYLESLGYKVLRFWNNEVLKSPTIVLEIIFDALAKRPQQMQSLRRPSP